MQQRNSASQVTHIDVRGKKKWAFPLAMAVVIFSGRQRKIVFFAFLLMFFSMPLHMMIWKVVPDIDAYLSASQLSQLIVGIFVSCFGYVLLHAWKRANIYMEIAKRATPFTGKILRLSGKRGMTIEYEYNRSGKLYNGRGMGPKHQNYREGERVDLVGVFAHPEVSLLSHGVVYNMLRYVLGLVSDSELEEFKEAGMMVGQPQDRYK